MHSRALLRVAVALAIAASSCIAAQVSWKNLSSSRNELPAPTGGAQQTACVTADFNRDGKGDFAVASRGSNGRIEVWLSSGSGWQRRPIEWSNMSLEAGGAAHDIDGDGDPDLVLGQDWSGDKIFWWENPSPNFGGAWTRRVLKSGRRPEHHDQVFGDFDGDNRAELAAWNQGSGELLLFEIPSNPRSAGSWPVQTIYRGNSSHEGLAAGDVDGDGTVDIVGAGRWWKHTGGGRYSVQVVDASMSFTRAAVGQLIPGGRAEIVFIPGDLTGNGYWYRWNGSGWQRSFLDWFRHGHTLDVADVDGDGSLDIFAGEMRLKAANCETRVFYGDGKGAFTKQVVATGNDIHEGRLIDVDGDGDLDIVHKPFDDRAPRIEQWINGSGGKGGLDKWRRHVLDANMPNTAVFVRTGDLDRDGWNDVVAGDSWYRNPGSPTGRWQRRAIGAPFHNLAAIHDFDGDGDLDLLGTQGKGASSNPNFAWAENNGSGSFTVRTNIQSGVGDFLQGVAVARFRAGGPLEVALSWHAGGRGVQMLTVPSQPRSQRWTWRRITSSSLEEDLSTGDIDGDGDLDLMLGTIWLENPSWTMHTLGRVDDLRGFGGRPGPDRNELVDVDRDGDLDVVVGLENGKDVLWFENPRPSKPATAWWPRHHLGWAEGQGFSLDAADFDGDGDVDVVVGEHNGPRDNRVLMFENSGKKSGWREFTIDKQPNWVADHHDGTRSVDIDRDGDLDIVSIGWRTRKLWLYENLRGQTNRRAATPELSAGGAFRSLRNIVMSTATAGAEIRYTLNGSDPTQASPRYTGPLLVDRPVIVKAKAFKAGMLPSGIASTFAAPVRGELAHWRLDAGGGGWAFDDGPWSIDAPLRGPAWTVGKRQSALDFDGRGAHLPAGTFDIPGSAMTISAWIRADSFAHLTGRDARIVSKAKSLADQDHYWMLSSIASGNEVRLRFRLKAGGWTSTLIASSGDVPVGRWAHVAARYDSRTMDLFLDGVRVGSLGKAGPVDRDPGAQVWIGDQPPTGGRPFDGRIDDVRVFARALGALELQALAAGGSPAGVRSYGRPTRACGSAPRIEALRDPKQLVDGFGFAAADAPPGAVGVLALSLGSSPGVPVLGANVYVSLQPGAYLFAGAVADRMGRSAISLPLWAAWRGARFHAQYLWIKPPSCPRANVLSASDALEVTVR